MSKKGTLASIKANSMKSKTANDPSLDWQITKRSVAEKFQFIFNSQRYADVHFIVGNGKEKQRIPAHKLILSVGSPVFDTMFSSNWDSNEIEVEDIEPVTFLSLLKFLYYDHVEVSMENILSLLYAAKKYIVPILEDHCVAYIDKNLNKANVFILLIQAHVHNHEKLKQSCLKIIDDHAQQAVLSPAFCDIDHDLLCSILERDSLKIKEYDLFQAVLRWCDAECKRMELALSSENRRSVLKEALYLLRFPLMSVDEFKSGVADSGLLSDRELSRTLLFLVGKKNSEIDFNETPRQSPFFTVNRYSSFSTDQYQCDGSERSMTFTVTHTLWLVGIGIYGPNKSAGSFTVSFTLEDGYQAQQRRNFHSIAASDAPNSSYLTKLDKEGISPCLNASKTFHLLFESPVEVNPITLYLISFSIKGPNTLYGQNAVYAVSMKLPDSNEEMTMNFHDDSGLMSSGQLPELLFTV